MKKGRMPPAALGQSQEMGPGDYTWQQQLKSGSLPHLHTSTLVLVTLPQLAAVPHLVKEG